jgi:hypothetical protein
MIADYLLHDAEPTFEIREMTILRYWQELVVPTDSLSTLVQQGRVENKDGSLV